MTELQEILDDLPRLAVGFDEMRKQAYDGKLNAQIFFDKNDGYIHIYTSSGWIGAPVESLNGDIAPFCS